MTNGARCRLTLRIKKPIEEKLSKACLQLGVSKNAFITMLLSEKLEKRDSIIGGANVQDN
jgi:predicted HicB family RNase H-like nuclease